MQRSAQIALISLLFGSAALSGPVRAQGTLPPQPAVAFPHPVYPTGSGTALGRQIDALLADPSVSRAHWGIAVTTLDGTPLYGHAEAKLFRPASNNKIFTTATAMALLGPYKSFQTRIYGNLDAATGTVTGDLTLVGGGDANFGADDLPYTPRKESADQPPAPPAPPHAHRSKIPRRPVHCERSQAHHRRHRRRRHPLSLRTLRRILGAG